MGTKIYGASDDLIEAEGDVCAEHGGGEDEFLLTCSDGTVLTIKYGKGGLGIWAIQLVNQGTLLNRIEVCDDEDADVYSDVAYFDDGLKYVYVASRWSRMR